jgi:hypothetical protein
MQAVGFSPRQAEAGTPVRADSRAPQGETLMAIVMRFVQRFDASKRQEFMDLEKQFAILEQRGILPHGDRMVPLAGREPGNTLIWEGRFESLAAAEKALKSLETSEDHTQLFQKQVPYFQDAWVEFYEVLNF